MNKIESLPDKFDYSDSSDFIQWKRMGMDATKEWEAEKVGTVVVWLDNFAVCNFSIKVDLLMPDNFKSVD